VPSPAAPPPGCRFSTRCPVAVAECSQKAPEWRTLRPGHQVACHLAEEVTLQPYYTAEERRVLEADRA